MTKVYSNGSSSIKESQLDLSINMKNSNRRTQTLCEFGLIIKQGKISQVTILDCFLYLA